MRFYIIVSIIMELYIAEFHILVGSLYSFTLFTNPLIY